MIINPLTKQPEDPRNKSCKACGLMDASVKKNVEDIGLNMCDDCIERDLDNQKYSAAETAGFDINNYGSN